MPRKTTSATKKIKVFKKSVTKNRVANKIVPVESRSIAGLKDLDMELTQLEKEIGALHKRMKDISHKKKISDTLSQISKLN
ncbi:MAG: hypothetical protein COU28_01190 [Candidatus Magasanikbacteria bacterium CG10_big_fil_rev_8_21_14_0_10_36_16]|uniref:Uncharacterized protein n=1 Tax=Candidatus Magasanikbacteria bacterium CG10_big_fil_rev_8_21_14_0_10_36_16 TaxID=1974645 RepID=A0A2H0TZ60_9BACT|nr:MAG: hypothetical protein COU28_01190 [Candidatus Magasanikbacteria bacterium CG10_big_fil_rev_8_21_14_0_10_36_16]